MTDAAHDYAARANQHRPADPAAVARAIRELASEGWTEYGIGKILFLEPAAVRRALSSQNLSERPA